VIATTDFSAVACAEIAAEPKRISKHSEHISTIVESANAMMFHVEHTSTLHFEDFIVMAVPVLTFDACLEASIESDLNHTPTMGAARSAKPTSTALSVSAHMFHVEQFVAAQGAGSRQKRESASCGKGSGQTFHVEHPRAMSRGRVWEDYEMARTFHVEHWQVPEKRPNQVASSQVKVQKKPAGVKDPRSEMTPCVPRGTFSGHGQSSKSKWALTDSIIPLKCVFGLS